MPKTKILLKISKKRVSLDHYAGKWVAFDENEKIVGYDETLEGLMEKMGKKGLEKKISVFLVPRKDEGPYILFNVDVKRQQSQQSYEAKEKN